MKMCNSKSEGYILLDVGGTFVKGSIAGPSGEVLNEEEFKFPMRSEGTEEEILGALSMSVGKGLSLLAARGLRLAGIGATVPGPFDYAKGIPLMKHKFQSVYGVDFKAFIHRLPNVPEDIPIVFDSDVIAALKGEMRCGYAKEYDNAAIVTIGTGLGFALSVDGNIPLSTMGSPAVTIYRTPCCDGILEDFVSKRGIMRGYRALSGDPDESLSVADIASRARSGDNAASQAFLDAGAALAGAIKGILAEYRIQCLLFGGQISKSFDLMEPAVREGLGCPAASSGADTLRSSAALPDLKLISQVKNMDTAALHGIISQILR